MRFLKNPERRRAFPARYRPVRTPVELMNLYDTIAAPATPPGESGIGIIRLSGPEAVGIAQKVFSGKPKVDLAKAPSHTVHYGSIVDKNGQMIDEVLLILLKAPRTFTREDTVEIDAHGGPYVMRRILQRLIEEGARLAEPGEFTKKAFLNGRIDLSQAEAVMDMIGAKTGLSLESAAKRLSGGLFSRIEQLRSQIMDLLVLLEVQIDYPEYEVEEAQVLDEQKTMKEILDELEKLYRSADTGRMLNEGIRVVLCGRPNMGKSTLLNAFLGEERAIVTAIPGTTRDTLEENMNLDGIPIRLIDTAGIRRSDDVVEQMGVERARSAIADSDLILYLIDSSGEITPEDLQTLQEWHEKPLLLVMTKSDLEEARPQRLLQQWMQHSSEILKQEQIVSISAKAGEGMEELKTKIRELVLSKELQSPDGIYLANVRQKQAVYRAIESVKSAMEAAEMELGSDMVSMDLFAAHDALGEVTGNSVSEDLVDTIFSRFCLGK